MEDQLMNRTSTAIALGAALTGFVAGYALKSAPAVTHSDLWFVPSALAQEKKSEVMPFNYNFPASPRSRPTRHHHLLEC